MKHLLPAIAVVGLLSVLPAQAAERPNILFIFSDDHAPHAIGAYNGWLKSVNPTPTIDRLAAQGMLFENSFCTNSICGPSRAVIMTGKHSHKNGFMNNGNSFDWDQQIFPKLLQKAGYQTALYGKSHLKGRPQGFDSWSVLPGQGLYYNPEFITPEGKVRVDGYCTDVVTEMAVKFLREDREQDKPFMLMVQHKAPHRNWMPAPRHLNLYDDITIPEPATLFDKWEDNAPAARHQELEIDRHMHLNFDLFLDIGKRAEGKSVGKVGMGRVDRSGWRNLNRMTADQIRVWQEAFAEKDKAFHAANLSGKDLVRWKFQRYAKNYLRCVKGVDESVERLMATLEELDLDDNTIVIYSSDQGFYIGDHGWYDKRWMYEESLKMPLIIKWPGVVQPGSRDTNLVQNIDYAPTFLDIAGAAIPADIQGKSLKHVLQGEQDEPWRDSIYYHYYEYPSVHMVPRHYGIRTERYKLMHFYHFDEWEFYDLQTDPDELANLYNDPAKAETIAEMKRQLVELQEHYQDDSNFKPMPRQWQEAVRAGKQVKSPPPKG